MTSKPLSTQEQVACFVFLACPIIEVDRSLLLGKCGLMAKPRSCRLSSTESGNSSPSPRLDPVFSMVFSGVADGWARSQASRWRVKHRGGACHFPSSWWLSEYSNKVSRSSKFYCYILYQPFKLCGKVFSKTPSAYSFIQQTCSEPPAHFLLCVLRASAAT